MKRSAKSVRAARTMLALGSLAPAVASRRMGQLATSTPVQASLALSTMGFEKFCAFSEAWANGFAAAAQMQARLFLGGAWPLAKSPKQALRLIEEASGAASSALRPIVRRVRRNAKRTRK